MAAYGAKSGGGEDPQKGLAYLRELITKHVTVQDKSGREALQDFASGNGDVLISYENEAITAQKKGQQVDYVIPDQTILIENPIAVVSKSKHPEQAKAFLDYALSPHGPAEVRRLGLPAGRRGGASTRTRPSSRPPAACSPSATSAAGARSTTRSSIPTRARWPRSRRTRGSPLPSEALTARVARRSPRVSGRPARTSALGLGVATLWLSVIVLIPLAALVARSTDGGLDTFWSAVTSRQAVAALKLSLWTSLVVAAVNAVAGTATAWVLVRDRVPRQGGAQRAHRPALRAADDRRRDHPARAGRADVAGRRPRRSRRRGRS